MTKLIKTFYIVVLSVAFIHSCTLNSDQERSLNIHISKYIDSRNNCQILGLVGYTYPEYVQELSTDGDSTFLKSFECNFENKKLLNPTIRSSKKKGRQIHVLFELDESELKNKESIIAITIDNGKNWYFLPYDIYKNDQYCKNLLRLL